MNSMFCKVRNVFFTLGLSSLLALGLFAPTKNVVARLSSDLTPTPTISIQITEDSPTPEEGIDYP